MLSAFAAEIALMQDILTRDASGPLGQLQLSRAFGLQMCLLGAAQIDDADNTLGLTHSWVVMWFRMQDLDSR